MGAWVLINDRWYYGPLRSGPAAQIPLDRVTDDLTDRDILVSRNHAKRHQSFRGQSNDYFLHEHKARQSSNRLKPGLRRNFRARFSRPFGRGSKLPAGCHDVLASRRADRAGITGVVHNIGEGHDPAPV